MLKLAFNIFEFDLSRQTIIPLKAEVILVRSDPRFPVLPGHFPRTYDFFGYVGDGLLSLSDFDDGILVTSEVTYNNEPSITVDVTNFIQNLIGASTNFAGFNVRQQEEISNSDAEYGRNAVLRLTTP